MDYRGLGSGIIRALQADSNIEFHNEVSGDQFRVIFWRTAVNGKDETVPSDSIGQETSQKIGQKIGQKAEAILALIVADPTVSRAILAQLTGLAPSTIQTYIEKLKTAHIIRRVGPDKGGYWEVIN